eukprot:347633-Chlamydomonas_euryale.AAC.2
MPGSMEGEFGFVEGTISQPTGEPWRAACPRFELEGKLPVTHPLRGRASHPPPSKGAPTSPHPRRGAPNL